MICSSAGMVASPPSRPKRLVPTKRLAANFSKPSASISLLRIAFLPSGVKLIVLVRPFDAALQPVLLLGIVDVHELIADAAAIGARSLSSIWRGVARLKAQHAVDEDRHVQRRRLRSRRMLGIERRLRRARRDAQRIEIGFQMADHAIGADHLDGVDGMPGAASVRVGRRRCGGALARRLAPACGAGGGPGRSGRRSGRRWRMPGLASRFQAGPRPSWVGVRPCSPSPAK